MEHDIAKLTDTAIAATKEAGEGIMELYASSAFETKEDGSPVTIADHRANDILLTALNETGIPVLTEESDGIDTPYPPLLWIIDPIDGTSGFIKSDGDFSIMVGLLKDGVPILGVVYAPAFDELFVGDISSGAYLQKAGVRSKLSIEEIGDPLRLVHTKNHLKPHFAKVAKELGAKSVSRGGIGIKVTILLKNEGDLFFSLGNLGEWDVCAPHAIYSAIGGKVTDRDGIPLTYGESDHRIQNGVIFSHPDCHKKACATIAQYKKE